jgi:metallo-beta-lactamase family protein
MRLSFHGAARTVTGSLHLLEVGDRQIALDCGLYQGKREDARKRNTDLATDPTKLHAVVLTHAHIDHSGNLPTYVERGFKGPIHATPATADLAKILLQDSAKIQRLDAEYMTDRARRRGSPEPVPPLYDDKACRETVSRFVHAPYRKPFDVAPGVRGTFYDAGHILGSAVVLLELEEGRKKLRVAYTGDLGRPGHPILKDPERPPFSVDYLIIESTYGNRVHEAIPNLKKKLKEVVTRAVQRGGRVIVPAFSVGRTQNLVYYLNQLIHDGEVPRLPVFVDSPLSADASEAYRSHPECFDEETTRFLGQSGDPLGFGLLTYVRTTDESKALNFRRGPCVVIASSGMCEAGRILHHLKQGVGRPENTILIVGYQAANTLGRRLVDKEKRVRIFGDEYDVRAEVSKINGFSAHADREELSVYAKNIEGLKGVFVVHGEEDSSAALVQHLRERGVDRVIAPSPRESVELD